MDYLVPGMLGFLVGAILWGLTYEKVFPAISGIANFGNTTIPDLWNVSPFLFIFLFVMITLLLFYLIDRAGWERKEK